MHEHHEAVHIIEHAEMALKERGHTKVKQINLVIGESSGFSPEAVIMNIEINAVGTCCEDVPVTVKKIKSMLKCPNCGELFMKKPFHFECPHCNTPGVPSEVGNEMVIDSIETQ